MICNDYLNCQYNRCNMYVLYCVSMLSWDDHVCISTAHVCLGGKVVTRAVDMSEYSSTHVFILRNELWGTQSVSPFSLPSYPQMFCTLWVWMLACNVK